MAKMFQRDLTAGFCAQDILLTDFMILYENSTHKLSKFGQQNLSNGDAEEDLSFIHASPALSGPIP